MLHKKEAMKQWCLANKLFTVFAAAQAVLLLCLLVALVQPKVVHTLALDAFTTATETTAVAIEDGVLQIENDAEDTSAITLFSEAFSLKAGAYTIAVHYQTAYDIALPSGSIYDESVALQLEASATQSLFVTTERLLLKDSATVAETRAWVSWGDAVDTAQIALYYNGVGQTYISEIVVEEQLIWRWFVLVVTLLAFAAIDLAYCLIFASTAPQHEVARKKRRNICAIVGIALVASLPLFSGFLYTTHDADFHLARIATLASELSYGQFPVRIATEMVNGYGYIASLFYCDIFLYLPAVLYNCMVPLQTTYQIYAVMVNVATVWIAYYCFKKLSNSASIALVGASLYTLASYRLTNFYVRGAAGEYTAMAFFPLVVLGLCGVYKSKKPQYQDWLPLALGMAGVIQCHVLSVEMLAIFLGLVCVLLLRQTLAPKRLKALVLAVLLCAGLSAWFWVPFLHSFLTMELLALANTFISIQGDGLLLSQLFALSGYVSYGESTAAMPLMIGWGLLASAGLAVWYMVQSKALRLASRPDYKAMRISLLLGVLAAAITMRAFPWDAIGYSVHPIIAKVVNLVQFPWRYLAIVNICFVAAAVLALMLVRQYHKPFYKAAMGVLVAISLCTTGLFYADFTAYADTEETLCFDYLTSLSIGWGEYMLVGSDFSESYTTDATSSSEALTIAGYEKVQGVAYVTYENTSSETQTVTLPIWSYPNYQATSIETGERYSITANSTNCIQIEIPAGEVGTVQVKYVAPWLWRVAECISLLSWAFVGYMAYVTYKIRKRIRNTEQDVQAGANAAPTTPKSV